MRAMSSKESAQKLIDQMLPENRVMCDSSQFEICYMICRDMIFRDRSQRNRLLGKELDEHSDIQSETSKFEA